MFKKSLILINLFVILALVLTACSSPAAPEAVEEPAADEAVVEEAAAEEPAAEEEAAAEEPAAEEPAAEPVTLQVWMYDSFAGDPEASVYAAADKFMEENPEITIELIPTAPGSSTYHDPYVTAAIAGGGPDVLIADVQWTAEFAAAGIALQLDEIAGDDIDAYYPGPVDSCTFQGNLYAVPFYTNAVAMFYNKTAFEAAGLPLPEAGWTWDDFANAATTLTTDDMYGFGLMAGWGGTFEWFPWLWQNGGEILAENDTVAAFNSPEGVEAAEAFLNLITTDGVVPDAAKTWKSWDELAVAFTSGTIAMYEVGDWGIAAVEEKNPDFEWGVAPLPMKETNATISGGANWVINPNSENTEAAYKWVQFITSDEVIFDLMDSYQRFAARAGGEQQIAKDDPRMQVFVDSLDYSRTRNSIANFNTVDWNCLQPAFLKVIHEGLDVASAMAEAETCANEALASGE